MYIEKLSARFPSYLADDIRIIETALDLSSKHESYEPFEISFEKNILSIPRRIYTDEHQLGRLKNLSLIQKEMIFCLYSRHHDGFVRERCLKEFVASNNSFTAPYILQLLGEYVIEIIEVIYQNREKINKNNISAYIADNSEHYEKTKQRVYSYWDCYYRSEYPKYRKGVAPRGESHFDYPGIKMVKYINDFLSNQKH